MSELDDIVYLKQFVKKHPDNQMGWYLLGRKYKELGKEGKANYCFLQAGDIYKAFENESHPMANMELHAQQMAMLKEWSRKARKRKLIRRTAVIAVLLLIAAFLIPLGLSQAPEEVAELDAGSVGERHEVGIIYVKQTESNPVGDAWKQLLKSGMPEADLVVAAKLEQKEGWRSWLGQTRLFMTIRNSSEAGLDVSLLDRYLCQCEPGDQLGLYKQYKEWARQQEHHWTLSSAIHHYERINGKWPEKLEELVQPYPNNYISGDSVEMHKEFKAILQSLFQLRQEENRAAASSSNSNAADSRALSHIGTNGLYADNWSNPLEIIVDKESHQLAVVQGDIIVRSYPVGLGDTRTPEGTFFISEKVRNPNGSDDGEFGSRGMTLSGTLYAIHGTNQPESIGKDESLGCIRMLKEDVEELFDMVPLGTAVQIKSGSLPASQDSPAERFQLKPRQDETNPAKVYRWLS